MYEVDVGKCGEEYWFNSAVWQIIELTEAIFRDINNETKWQLHKTEVQKQIKVWLLSYQKILINIGSVWMFFFFFFFFCLVRCIYCIQN